MAVGRSQSAEVRNTHKPLASQHEHNTPDIKTINCHESTSMQKQHRLGKSEVDHNMSRLKREGRLREAPPQPSNNDPKTRDPIQSRTTRSISAPQCRVRGPCRGSAVANRSRHDGIGNAGKNTGRTRRTTIAATGALLDIRGSRNENATH